jgi:hypothetical protein
MSPLSNALRRQWRPDLEKHGVAKVARKHFDSALDLADILSAKRAEIDADKTLSDIGRTQKLAAFAAAEAPRVAKAMNAVTAAKDAVRKQRLALTPAVKDPNNLANAMLRQEVRAMLRGKSDVDAFALAMAPGTDSLIIEAIFEAPTVLSNISPAHRDRLLTVVVERTAGPQLAALAEQDKAVELLETAVRASTDELCEAAGVQRPMFDKWIAETAPVDPKETETELAAFNAEALTAAASALPLKARMTLVDQLLATNTAEVLAA